MSGGNLNFFKKNHHSKFIVEINNASFDYLNVDYVINWLVQLADQSTRLLIVCTMSLELCAFSASNPSQRFFSFKDIVSLYALGFPPFF